MKHSTECVNLWTDELVALATVAGITIPQSLQDLITRWPPDPPGVANAQTRAMAKLALAIKQRSDTRTDYQWAFSTVPPSWQPTPQQVQSQGSTSMSSELSRQVLPPADWSLAPNPAAGEESDNAGGGDGNGA